MTAPPWQSAVAHVRTLAAGPPLPPEARVVVHFHPDAPAAPERTVLEAIVADGVYRSQFETGTSNGGLTAHRGGDRWAWESRLFGRAYDTAPSGERPRYGALALHDDPYGAAPRFGSCHLRLQPHVLARTTFCFPDSAHDPHRFGTVDRCDLPAALAAAPPADPLDRYVEAHVHGGVRLAEDVQAIVLDPSYRGTALADVAAGAGVAVRWHAGYRTSVASLDPAYRGREPVRLAARIAGQGLLTPARMGSWRARDDVDARALKQVWHLLARFGRAAPHRAG
ncbi:uncharacterized protein DUF3626 [Isoptericola jiangsuensis]|uniref:Uncharacterized protein DUF3626 n=1 Tax=Isoptericola jiangsuensis TaxID=548579 RepID=A0A2A9EXH6_9MICO|nr:DUF3626 domain-containing protein [Isoptericola jiangsuensis]PFG43211.1 uncharacterized protein DUF3626 [Isoptericola jiangsuensis]